MALAGTLLTRLLPETSRRSLEDIWEEGRGRAGLGRLAPVVVQAEAA